MSRRTQLLVSAMVLLLSLSIAAPAAAAPAPEANLTGTLELLHGEDLETGEATYDYTLHTGRESVALRFDGDAPEGFVNGATVNVRGRRAGAALVALDGASSGQVLVSAPGWAGPRKLAVILINFTNNTTKPFSRTYANGVMFTNANSVRAYFAEQSHNAIYLAGTTFDWIKVPYSSTSCQYGAWELAAKAKLTQNGVDLSSYTNFMFMFPHTNACAWSGLGYLPGRTSWINGTPSLRTPAHELSHNFGVHHASTLRCTTNGVRVALSKTCTKSEYGDPFTTMGASGKRHETNLALSQMGYLPSTAARTIKASGTYTLTHASAASGTRIIGIPRGNGTWFYLEYRRPYGTHFDNFSSTSAAVKGVSIRIAKSWTTITQSQLIDTVPSTTTFSDAPLRLSKSFKDYVSGVRITVTGLGTSTATVQITLPADTTAPTAPGSVSASASSSSSIALAWTAATDNRAVAGYRIWRGGTLLTTTAGSALGFTDTGLAGATAYAYSIRAIDGAGNVSAAVAVSATTKPVDTAPTAPGSLAASALATSIRLTWTPATDNLGITQYRVWRDGIYVGTTTALAYSVTGLTPETTYTLSVRAVDTIGQLGAAATVAAATTFVDVTAPSRTVATITASNSKWADLAWLPATDNVGVVSYRILRNGTFYATVAGSQLQVRVPLAGSYVVIAIDAAGNVGQASVAVGV